MKTIYKPTGQVFKSRKEAKDTLCNNFYRNAFKFGDIELINDDTIANDGSVYTVTDNTTKS